MSGYTERATTRRRQAGFTLIEVMVAIMLMAIVSLMAWRGLDSIARASAHLEDSTEQGAALLRALNQLERDIALHSAIREETGLPIGDEPIRAGDSLPPGLALKRLSEIPLRLDIVRASTEQRIGDQPVAGHPQRRGALSTGGGPAMKRWLSRAAPPRPAGG